MSKPNEETVSMKLAQLGEMVAWFESDEFELEQAVERFDYARQLADEIEASLTKLQNEIVVLKQKFDTE